MTTPDWIAVDWGTSHLRIWRMAGDTVLSRATSEDGMGRLARDGYEPVLTRQLHDLPPGRYPVVICGMAGSRQGWAEAPYTAAPCAPPVSGVAVPTQDPRWQVTILPGVKQDSPADVMRGEETQIAGFMALNPRFDGVICLPGTHTKWVQVSAGEIVSFRTFMTGEMFALLSSQSVLRHSVGQGWDDAAFLDSVQDAMSRPEALAARLFTLRAEGLLRGLAPDTARARLSGLLIGAELAAARPYWLGQALAVVGADALARAYVAALGAQGAQAVQANADRMTLEGLKAARQGVHA